MFFRSPSKRGDLLFQPRRHRAANCEILTGSSFPSAYARRQPRARTGAPEPPSSEIALYLLGNGERRGIVAKHADAHYNFRLRRSGLFEPNLNLPIQRIARDEERLQSILAFAHLGIPRLLNRLAGGAD